MALKDGKKKNKWKRKVEDFALIILLKNYTNTDLKGGNMILLETTEITCVGSSMQDLSFSLSA